jgi:hypothetical protein
VRFVLAFGFHKQEAGRPEPVQIAIALAESGTFGNPYAAPTGPTAHAAPFYPMALAPIYALFGDSRNGDLARTGMSILVAATEYALLPVAALSLGMGVWPGAVAGLAGALVPVQYWAESIGNFEAPWIGVFLLAATIQFGRLLRKEQAGAGSAFWAGALWGFGLLIAPNVLPVVMGFAAVYLWRKRPPMRAAVRDGLVMLGAAALVVCPWEIRNYIAFGEPFLVRSNFGLELYVSNNDAALANYVDNISTPYFQSVHPFTSRAEAVRVKEMGEAAYNREKFKAALDWIRSHPGRFSRLTAERAVNFWFPDQTRRSAEILLGLVTLLAAAGFWRLWRDNPGAAAVPATLLITYPLVYYVLQNYIRYEHPIYWVLVLLAAYPFGRMAERAYSGGRGGQRDEEPC